MDKSLLTGNTTMLILSLLSSKDMYGYEMIEELSKRSNNVFSLKAGTLYPLLHDLEKKDIISSYEDKAENTRLRKYYSITKKGKKLLCEKRDEWNTFASAINSVVKAGDLVENQ